MPDFTTIPALIKDMDEDCPLPALFDGDNVILNEMQLTLYGV